jgi:hypothetical protein
MDSITPNKEVIRRICILNGGTCCYISHIKGDAFIEILTDITEERLNNFSKELSEWSGINYKVFSLKTPSDNKNEISHINNKILPINN